MHGRMNCRGRIKRIAKIEIVDHVANPRTQLDGNIVMPVPYRSRFESGCSDALGIVLSECRGAARDGGNRRS